MERTVDMALQFARALGQDEELLARIASGEEHPAMAAYGLWSDDDNYLDDFEKEIYANRRLDRALVDTARNETTSLCQPSH